MCPVHYSTLGQYQARHQAGGISQKSSAVIQQLIHSSNYYISNSNAARVHYSSVSASFEPDMIAAPPNDGDLCQDAKYLDEMKTKHRYQRPERQRLTQIPLTTPSKVIIKCIPPPKINGLYELRRNHSLFNATVATSKFWKDIMLASLFNEPEIFKSTVNIKSSFDC